MADMKLGMVGLDTSHCTAFARLLNNKDNRYHVPGGRIIVAYPGGSPVFANSRNRLARFTSELQTMFQVTTTDNIATVAEQSDAIFLESVDGRQHLEQFRQLAPFRKPVFIDKPLATSIADAREIIALSLQYGTPICTASSIRYASGLYELGMGQKVLGCTAYGPNETLSDFPGFFWYGIHSAEMVYEKMGRGCEKVTVTKATSSDMIVGSWRDGRMAAIYGYNFENISDFGMTLLTEQGIIHSIEQPVPPAYATLMPRIIDFFRSGQPFVDPTESLEVIAFLEAANASKESGKEELVQL